MRKQLLVISFVGLALPVASQTSPWVKGDKSQTAGTNNGVMIQNNITVKPARRSNLKQRAQRDFGSKEGWLGTISPAHDRIDFWSICAFPSQNPFPSYLPLPPHSTDPPSLQKGLTVMLGFRGSAGHCFKDECAIAGDEGPVESSKKYLVVRKGKASIQLDADVFDSTGKIIALMRNGRLHVNPNNAFDWSRPDDHTVQVIDQYGKEVLFVRYANPHVVVVRGIFVSSSGHILKIGDDEIEFNNTFSNNAKMTKDCYIGERLIIAF